MPSYTRNSVAACIIVSIIAIYTLLTSWSSYGLLVSIIAVYLGYVPLLFIKLWDAIFTGVLLVQGEYLLLFDSLAESINIVVHPAT